MRSELEELLNQNNISWKYRPKLSHWIDTDLCWRNSKIFFPRYAVETVWKRCSCYCTTNDKSIVRKYWSYKIQTENYPYQQYMADLCINALKMETLFKILQYTFYQQALSLQKGQKMEYSPPPKQKGGTDHIEEQFVTAGISFPPLTSL